MNKRKIKQLEQKLENLKMETKLKRRGELTFNFKYLLGHDIELMTYKKECKTYYYLKRCRIIFCMNKSKVLTPEFESETELMIYIINNYEKIKKELKEEENNE